MRFSPTPYSARADSECAGIGRCKSYQLQDRGRKLENSWIPVSNPIRTVRVERIFTVDDRSQEKIRLLIGSLSYCPSNGLNMEQTHRYIYFPFISAFASVL